MLDVIATQPATDNCDNCACGHQTWTVQTHNVPVDHFLHRNNNDNEHDAVGDDDEESPEAKLERERLRRQQNNARERFAQ